MASAGEGEPRTGITHDTLFDGRLLCGQWRQGYRFSIDAVLLAHFCRPRRRDRVLDLGAGCGVLSLILAYRHPLISLTCLEIQESLLALIRHNIRQNGLGGRLALVGGDLRRIQELLAAGDFDLVVANPPYYPLGSGRRNLEGEQAVARHELFAQLDDVLRAAAYALRNKGTLVMVYPASRGAALIGALRAQRLEPKRLQAVYPYPGAEASLLLVEAVKNGGPQLSVLPPLYVQEAPGAAYSPEVAACFAPEPPAKSSVSAGEDAADAR